MYTLLEKLTPGRTYSIQVRSVDGDAYSTWGPTLTFTVTNDVANPPVVDTPAVSWVGDTVVASWTYTNRPLDFNNYEYRWHNGTVYSPILSTPGVTASLTFSDNVAFFSSPAPTVKIEVRAKDRSGNPAAGGTGWVASATTTNANPSQNTNIAGTAGPNKINLTWDVPTFDDYSYVEVYVGATSGFTATPGTNRIFRGNTNGYSYPSGSYVVDQYFKAAFFDKFNLVGPYSVTGALRPTDPTSLDTTPPADPNAATATGSTDATDVTGSASQIAVSWTTKTSDSDLKGYKVRVAPSAGGAPTYYDVPRSGAAGTSYSETLTVRGLVAGSSYNVAVAAYDTSQNLSNYINTGTYPTTTPKDTAGPLQPSAPNVSSNAMMIQVSHDMLKQGGGAMDADTSYFEVYLSTTTPVPVTIGTTIPNGTMKAGPGTSAVFPVPAAGGTGTQNWYARVLPVDTTGNRGATLSNTSVASAVPLIAATNIIDATITNAKIFDLDVTKLNAGTITAKTFTIGSNGHFIVDSTGDLKSSDYASGAIGWRLSKAGLEVNDGALSGRVITVTSSVNLIPAYMSIMTQASPILSGTGITNLDANTSHSAALGLAGASSPVDPLNEGTAMGVGASNLTPTTSNNGLWFGQSNTDYNVPVAPSTQYTFSMYVCDYIGTTSLRFQYKNQAGTLFMAASDTAVSGSGTAWRRVSYTFTTSAACTSIIMGTCNMSYGTWWLSGLQLEQAATASAFVLPSVTSIDGSSIRTGQIYSNQNTTVNGVSMPKWSINMAGAANFADVTIRGSAVVGAGVGNSLDGASSFIQSADFITNTSGWQVKSNGDAEFNKAVIRTGGSIANWVITPTTLQSATSSPLITLTASTGIIDINNSGKLTAGGTTFNYIGVQGHASTVASNNVYIRTTSTAPGYNLAGTSFWVDGQGRFSLAQKLRFDGTTLTTKDLVVDSGGNIALLTASGNQCYLYWKEGSTVQSQIYCTSDGGNNLTLDAKSNTVYAVTSSASNAALVAKSITNGKTANTSVIRAECSDTSGFFLVSGSVNVDVTPDRVFNISNTGGFHGSGYYTTGIDYAEFFEWEDGNPNEDSRKGSVVVFGTDGKVRLFESGDDVEDIIGAVSTEGGVYGNAYSIDWQGKYEKDLWGAVVYEDINLVSWNDSGNTDEVTTYIVSELPSEVSVPEDAEYFTRSVMKVSDNYDPEAVYVSREFRPEWTPVGLLGQLKIYKAQPKNPRWVKIRDLSSTVELWLVR